MSRLLGFVLFFGRFNFSTENPNDLTQSATPISSLEEPLLLQIGQPCSKKFFKRFSLICPHKICLAFIDFLLRLQPFTYSYPIENRSNFTFSKEIGVPL